MTLTTASVSSTNKLQHVNYIQYRLDSHHMATYSSLSAVYNCIVTFCCNQGRAATRSVANETSGRLGLGGPASQRSRWPLVQWPKRPPSGRLGLGGPERLHFGLQLQSPDCNLNWFGVNLPLLFKLHEICSVDSEKSLKLLPPDVRF